MISFSLFVLHFMLACFQLRLGLLPVMQTVVWKRYSAKRAWSKGTHDGAAPNQSSCSACQLIHEVFTLPNVSL